jgi:hypothetical protein
VERRYVGIDLHRRRSVIYTMSAEGEKVSCVRIANDPVALSLAVADAGDDADVVIEAVDNQPGGAMHDLLESALAAHGGLDRWDKVKSITVDASFKNQTDALKNIRFEVDTTRAADTT